ncbi:MAG TPA: hypothetical protein PKD05_20235 [Candidatus Melainabacteria bacterium]|nr:hypothetical protein [Candidatus Melainabacteria bacterium]
MAADQVQEKPKEPEAKASDAAAGKAAEAPQSQQEKDAVGAQAKLSDEASGKPADAQNSTDAAGTATKDASRTLLRPPNPVKLLPPGRKNSRICRKSEKSLIAR